MRPIGKETIPVYSDQIATLNVPAGARVAVIFCNADAATANKNAAVRFWTTGDDPTATEGLYLGDSPVTSRWLHRYREMNGFKCIGVQAGRIHFLNVEYYR